MKLYSHSRMLRSHPTLPVTRHSTLQFLAPQRKGFFSCHYSNNNQVPEFEVNCTIYTMWMTVTQFQIPFIKQAANPLSWSSPYPTNDEKTR